MSLFYACLLRQQNIKFLLRGLIGWIIANGLLKFPRRVVRSSIFYHLSTGAQVEHTGIEACVSLVQDVEGIGRIRVSGLLVVHYRRVPILVQFGLMTLTVINA